VTKGQDANAHSLERGELAGSGLPQQPGACREGRAPGRDGGIVPPAFQWVRGHLQHHPTRETNGKKHQGQQWGQLHLCRGFFKPPVSLAH